jgi:AraC family transcriptional regulator
MNDTASKIITGEEYDQYHPGQVEITSKSRSWSGLLFTRYSHPRTCNGSPRPATKDHLLAFSNNGAVKGEYSFCQGKWKPYTWQQGEWLLGQAYENDRDSRWNSLCDEKTELSVCYIHLSPEILMKAACEAADRSPQAIELPHRMSFKDSLMYQLGMALKYEAENEYPYGTLLAETVANMLSVHLLRNYCTVSFNVNEYRGTGRHRGIDRAIELIHTSLDKDLSLEEMAITANMSSYHFARIFKNNIGVAPHQYIMNARIKRAKELLISTNLPINLIALEVGYNPNHFSYLFKRVVRHTPREYRTIAKS